MPASEPLHPGGTSQRDLGFYNQAIAILSQQMSHMALARTLAEQAGIRIRADVGGIAAPGAVKGLATVRSS